MYKRFAHSFTIFSIILTAICFAPNVSAAALNSSSLIDRTLESGNLNVMGEGPAGDLCVTDKYVAVADAINNRVIIWDHIPTTNEEPYDVVITGLNGPMGVFTDNTKLFVTDTFNNRVLMWNEIPTEDTVAGTADLVLGQDNMLSVGYNRGEDPAANSMGTPMTVFYDGTRLYVSDVNNGRVLIWTTLPNQNGQDADLVLGAATLTSAADTYGSSTSINRPNGIYVYKSKLYISDGGMQRVLIWNSIPDSNDKEADLVLGQEDFTGYEVNRGHDLPAANTLAYPMGIVIQNDVLYVGDPGNNRVLIWDTLPTQNGQNATGVLGQPDFVSNNTNNNSESVNSAGFNQPSALGNDGVNFYVLDSGNNRVAIYDDSIGGSISSETTIKTFNKDLRCLWSKPVKTTWIKAEATTINGVKGVNLTWTQYGADKVSIKIDDGTGNYPWRIADSTNDGHQFIPNVQSWQNIAIKPKNHCKSGVESVPVSADKFPGGWYNLN